MYQKLIKGIGNNCWIFNAWLLGNEKFTVSDIANAHHILIWFDAPENDTLEESGAKSDRIRICRAEKERASVILAVTADGKKLEPHVIFKRQSINEEKFRKGILVGVQEKRWNADTLIVDFLKHV